MTNLEKYNEVFKENLSVDDEALNETLIYQSVPDWDSVGHMGLVSALEEAFDIMMETDDIIEFNSYLKGKEILKKYDVIIE
ncbi:MAG: acyl carrier protein [Lachnospiraceae bacterium]|jgi:acyl carrier protein|nr:acyl carrier protein [Lachnospiraceae bacterium]